MDSVLPKSESWYFAEDTFHLVLTKLLCYIHHDVTDEYGQWMSQCVDKDQFKAKDVVEIQTNSKSKGFVPTDEQRESIAGSFDVCNQWLRELLDENYPDILLHSFDWALWYT